MSKEKPKPDEGEDRQEQTVGLAGAVTEAVFKYMKDSGREYISSYSLACAFGLVLRYHVDPVNYDNPLKPPIPGRQGVLQQCLKLVYIAATNYRAVKEFLVPNKEERDEEGKPIPKPTMH